jgi:hypothetical protein
VLFRSDFSDIDIDMGKDKETFMDSVDGIIESLYNQGGYRNISFIKEYLKHLDHIVCLKFLCKYQRSF